jgi:hypothetical protein
VLIIDDAELLLSDAIAYLRLLASIAMQRMPQIVFVGDPSFWDVAARTAGFTELITARFELAPLSRKQMRGAAELGMVVSFVAAPQAINTNTHQKEAAIATSPSDAFDVRYEHHPVPAVGIRAALTPTLSDPRHGMSFARMACLAAVVVGLVVAPTHRLAVLLVAWVTPEPQETALRQPSSEGSPSMIGVRLPPAAMAMADTSDPDGLTAPLITEAASAPDFTASPLLPDAQGSRAIARPKRVAKARAVEIQRPPGSASRGTWLFQANLTGGSNS